MEEAIQQTAKEESLKATMKSCKNNFYNIEYVLHYSIYFLTNKLLYFILILISRSDRNIANDLVSNFIIPLAHRVISGEGQYPNN